MKLCNLVDIIENNKECVILKVKTDARLELIKLGCFDGNEDVIRLTKGKNHVCTIINKDCKSTSWYWGASGYTLVSYETSKKGKLIEECITEDFDIYIGDNESNINNSLGIRSLEDTKNAIHYLKFMYWDKDDPKDICIHKDNEFYKRFKSIDEAENHFIDLGYELEKIESSDAKTGCTVDKYCIEKTMENEKVM